MLWFVQSTRYGEAQVIKVDFEYMTLAHVTCSARWAKLSCIPTLNMCWHRVEHDAHDTMYTIVHGTNGHGMINF